MLLQGKQASNEKWNPCFVRFPGVSSILLWSLDMSVLKVIGQDVAGEQMLLVGQCYGHKDSNQKVLFLFLNSDIENSEHWWDEGGTLEQQQQQQMMNLIPSQLKLFEGRRGVERSGPCTACWWGGLPPRPDLLSASFPFLVLPGWSHPGSWAVAEEPGSQQSKSQGSGFLFQLWTSMSVQCTPCNNWSHMNSTVSEPVEVGGLYGGPKDVSE